MPDDPRPLATNASTPGARFTPLTKLVLDELRQRIVSRALPPGERLIEGRLSEELGVSRMPVREALRELAAEGMVTIEPRRGAIVAQYTEEQTREMIDVRAALEGLNAKLAARRHDPAQVGRLKAILVEGASLTAADDLGRVAALNVKFHEALGETGANALLRDMMRSLRDRTSPLFVTSDGDAIRRTWDEHAGILQAVIDGDAELAALLASRHVYSAASSSGYLDVSRSNP